MEFGGINRYREKKNVDELVYAPELAALANYRAWVNQENEYVGHTWLDLQSSKDIINLYFIHTILESKVYNRTRWYEHCTSGQFQ